MDFTKKSFNKETILIFILCLVGIILRFMWPEDMQWKADQIYMWEHAKAIAEGKGIEWIGMPSGVSVRNPGLGLWIFSFIALFCDSPPDMVPFIAAFNVIAIIIFFYFVQSKISIEGKNIYGDNPQTWLWAVALYCVNPMAILFSRDIWATNTLSIFTVLIMMGAYSRQDKWGAFCWGMFGAMIGQIHMPGFFFSFGIVVFMFLHDKKNNIKTNWFFWFLGSVVGTIPMLPWIPYAIEYYANKSTVAHQVESSFSFAKHFNLKFFYYLAYDSIGVHLRFMMGGKAKDIWQGPLLLGKSTYLLGICYVYLVGILVWKAKFLVFKLIETLKQLYERTFFVKLTFIDQLLYSTVIGMGIVLTITGIRIHPHYLSCLYPIILFWPIKIFIKHKRILFGIILCQLLISFSFFRYVHVNEGVQGQEYGDTYRYIMEQRKLNPNYQSNKGH